MRNTIVILLSSLQLNIVNRIGVGRIQAAIAICQQIFAILALVQKRRDKLKVGPTHEKV